LAKIDYNTVFYDKNRIQIFEIFDSTIYKLRNYKIIKDFAKGILLKNIHFTERIKRKFKYATH